jgi:radical SAM superfamily enzyme YgiQ (UPF0313 family)
MVDKSSRRLLALVATASGKICHDSTIDLKPYYWYDYFLCLETNGMCAKRKSTLGKNEIHLPAEKPSDIRVLYIHPAKQGVDFRMDESMGRNYGLIPVGLPGLVNLLRQNGIEVRGINYSLERQIDPQFDIKAWLGQFPTARVILIDLHWYEHCYGAIQAAKLCKEVLPQAYTLLGGLSASGFSSQIMEQFPEVDFIIRGDAEQPLLDFVQRALQPDPPASFEDIPNLSYRQGNTIQENEVTYCAGTDDLDRLNFADIDFLDHHQHYYVHEYLVTDIQVARQALATKPFWGKWITTARGCKHECSYCGGCKTAHKALANRDGIVIRSPRAVVDEIEQLQNAGVTQAALSYDIAELGDDYWQEFFSLIKSRNIQIGLYNELFQNPSVEFIHALARNCDRAHSAVAISPLTGNVRLRRLNGKIYNNDQLFDTLEVLNQYNFYIFVYFSLNLPGETDETFNETLELANQIYDFYPSSLLKILNTIHTIDPLSPMNMHPEKFGIVSSMSTFMDYYNYCMETQLARPEAKTEQLRGYQLADPQKRNLQKMVQRWEAQRIGKENSWWPVPPSW